MYALHLSLFFYKLLLYNFLLILGYLLQFIEENTFCLIDSLRNIGVWHFSVFTLSRFYEDFLLRGLIFLTLIQFYRLRLLHWKSRSFRPIYLFAFINQHFRFCFFFCYYFRLEIFEIIVIFVSIII